MRNQIVILAAGKGTRMGSGDVPKVLAMLGNKPIILYLLEELEKINQLVNPVVVVGYKHGQVKAVLGSGYSYALQEQQLGTAHAVASAKPCVRAETILVLYGDMPFIRAESLKRLMRLHQADKSLVSMFTATVSDFTGSFSSLSHFGRIIRDSAGCLVKITEYKDATDQERGIKEVNPGIYMFNAAWLWENINKIKNRNIQQEYYLTDIIEVAIKQGITVASLPIPPREVLGINTLEELAKAEELA
jgi:bifunctional UDP-N-acetylglucosamine pyrophosphorylase/glucosamine-1-phosphate N-acetyltransferase